MIDQAQADLRFHRHLARVALPSRGAGAHGASLGWMWPAGLVAAVVGLLEVWRPLAGKGADLAQYAAQGAVVPLALLAYVVIDRARGAQQLRPVRVLLGIVAGVAAAAVVILHLGFAAPVLTCAQLAVTALVARAPLLRGGRARHTALTALVLLAGWTTMLTLVWWGPPSLNPVAIVDAAGRVPAAAWKAPMAVIVAVAALCLCVAKFQARATRVHRWPRWLPLAAAALLFAYVAAQTMGLRDPSSAMTWGFYVGPAELIRQGGWPLWDVPSQYGVLSVLLVAWAPIHSAWEALFVLNACANVALALLVFWVLRRREGGILDWLASALMAVAVVFLRAGLLPYFAGPAIFPSTGGYRFVFVVALLAVLLRVARQPSHGIPARWLVAGTSLWLVSLAWSADAGLYATAAWIPAYLSLAWAIAGHRRALRARLLAAPFVALLGMVGVVGAVYVVGLGHLPDLQSYLEYATTYAGGFGALPADPAGPALALLACLAVLGSLWVRSARRNGIPHATTAFLTGAFLATWATASYFAVRSHPNNAVNLAPVLVVCLAGAVQLTGRELARPDRVDLRSLLVPLVGALMVGTFGDLTAVTTSLLRPPASVASVQSLFWSRPGLAAFMANAHIPAGSPVVVVDDPADSLLPPQDDHGATYWLPLAPYGELNLLPPAERMAHLQRFVERHRLDGWLIVHRSSAGGAWLTHALQGWYSPLRTVSHADWVATYYRYRG